MAATAAFFLDSALVAAWPSFTTDRYGFRGGKLSLYQPTHRHHPENQQDPIRFRGLVKDLELLLLENHPAAEVSALLEPLETLGGDAEFWNHTLDGLAAFAAPGWARVIGLTRKVQELTVVADSFHTKPLRRFLQSADRYQVLGLNLHEIKLFEGDRGVIEEIDLEEGVPRTIADALGEELTEAHQTVASYGGVGGGSVAMRHGHGGKSDEIDNDADREIAGHIHDGSGSVLLDTTDHPQGDDLLDDLGERVLKLGGEVFVIPAGQMPTDTGAAATCRY